MPNITIDDKLICVPDGATVLEAAELVGIKIPTLCHFPGVKAQTSCMVCLVRINGANKLSPSCSTVVSEGMIVESEAPEIFQARKTALELLLGDHRGDCIAPCQDVCPAHIDIPQVISLLASGDCAGTIELIKEQIALPAVISRICPEICEKGCRRGRIDSPVSIRRIIRHAADSDLTSDAPYLPTNMPPTGKLVGVIGSGPAGLSAAYYLARAGHYVSLYDRAEIPGGALRRTEFASKIPASVLDAEIDLLMKSGIKFNGGVETLDLECLLLEQDAIVLCIGALSGNLLAEMSLELSDKGILVDSETYMTSRESVFAAGSCVTPLKQAVRACAQGRQVAISVSNYLAGGSEIMPERPYGVRMGQLLPDELGELSVNCSRAGRVPDSDADLSVEELKMETGRCLHCECAKLDNCRLRAVSQKLAANPLKYKAEHRRYVRDISHPDIVHEPSKCISCGLCTQIATNHKEELGLTFIDRGFNVEIGIPFDLALSEALKKVAMECVDACPTAALHVRRKEDG